MEEKQIDRDQVAGLGIGVPGPVNSRGEVLGAVNLGWGYKDVASELGQLLGFPVRLEMMPTLQPSARCGWAAEKEPEV